MNVRQTHVTAVGHDAAADAAADPLRIQVSAFVDNELDDASVERVIDALLASDELADFWTDAHRAGDWLRSEEVVDVGDGEAFLERFSATLASEPAIIAAKRRGGSRSRRFWMRTGLPGASVAAALVVVAWVAAPSIGGDKKDAGVTIAIVPADKADASGIKAAGFTPTADPDRLNDYVAAHRDVTPFAYRGTAGVRPAAFTATPANGTADATTP